MIREDPYYSDWIVMRYRPSGVLSEYEDSYEIQNEKGKRIIDFSESEIDLLISSATLLLVLDNVRRLGVFNRFGKRAPYVILLGVLSIPVVAFFVVMQFYQYIRTLPDEQTFLGFLGFIGILLCFVGILCFSQRNAGRRRQEIEQRKSRQEPISDELLDDVLDKVKELEDLKQNDPAEYVRRLKEMKDE